MVGEGLRPVEAYLNIPDIVRVAVENDVRVFSFFLFFFSFPSKIFHS